MAQPQRPRKLRQAEQCAQLARATKRSDATCAEPRILATVGCGVILEAALERNRYLDLAERVISVRGVPLTGRDIIASARQFDILPYDEYTTIVKTLQARIAEDISRHRDKSRFIRTGIGTYFLRSLLDRDTIFGRIRRSLERLPRAKPEHPNRILSIPVAHIKDLPSQLDWQDAQSILKDGSYFYQSELKPGYVPVVTAVALQWGPYVFSFRMGSHTHFKELEGQATVLTRKFLDEYDLDLFEDDGIGATSSTARTVLPLLREGRKSRLESGRLNSEEKIHFFEVSSLLRSRAAFYSGCTNSFHLLSLMDLSEVYSGRPHLQRRMEMNCANWITPSSGNFDVSDSDAIHFLHLSNNGGAEL